MGLAMIAVAGLMWIGGLPSSAVWPLLALCVAAAAAGTGAALDTGAALADMRRGSSGGQWAAGARFSSVALVVVAACALATALRRPAPPAR